MVRLGALIGVRATDIRMMQRGQIRDDVLVVRPHKTAKTGHQQHWEITLGVRAILDEAKRLRGAVRSLCVFPNRKGTPYTEQSLSRAFTRAAQKAKVPVQFRDLRKTAINAAKAKGDNASDFAGHQDPRTTRAHYEVEPVKVRPLDAGTAPLPVDDDAASA